MASSGGVMGKDLLRWEWIRVRRGTASPCPYEGMIDPGNTNSLLQYSGLDREDRRQVIGHQFPVIAAVTAVDKLPGGGTFVPAGLRQASRGHGIAMSTPGGPLRTNLGMT